MKLGHQYPQQISHRQRRRMGDQSRKQRVDLPKMAQGTRRQRLCPRPVRGLEAGNGASGACDLVGEADALAKDACQQCRGRAALSRTRGIRARIAPGTQRLDPWRPTEGIGLGRMAARGVSAASASRARMRFSVLGWVEKRLSMRAPVNGLMMNIGAEVGLRSAVGISTCPA